MTRLPNLELLMHKGIGHLGLDKEFMEKVIKAKSDGIRTFNFQIETFPQIWGSTCTGFDITEDGKAIIGGCAMTTEYTTVVHEENTESYLIFFGDRPCYAVHNPTKEFYEDLKERRLVSLSKSKERY